jgi:hypothetical protein
MQKKPPNEYSIQSSFKGLRSRLAFSHHAATLFLQSHNCKTKEISEKFPEIMEDAKWLQRKAKTSIALSGIITARERKHLHFFISSSYRISSRLNYRNRKAIARIASRIPATFYAYDLLMPNTPYSQRLAQLSELLAGMSLQRIAFMPTISGGELAYQRLGEQALRINKELGRQEVKISIECNTSR